MEYTAESKERIDKFLAAASKVSRGRIQAAIKEGKVKIDGIIVIEADQKILPGQKAAIELTSDTLLPLHQDIKIVFENQDILVVDKPANLVVHPGAGHKQDTLSNILLAKYPGIEKVGDPKRPGIVHRLDEDTSGLIVCAKTGFGFEYMKQLFLKREVEKEYLALVHGIPKQLHGTVNDPIGRSSTHMKMKVGIGREALTEYLVVATNEKVATQENTGLDLLALLKVKLHTGRTHQIRVHLAHLKHPIVGDLLYGGEFKKSDIKIISRQFLHAFRLKFKLSDGSVLDLVSQLPNDLEKVLKAVGIILNKY